MVPPGHCQTHLQDDESGAAVEGGEGGRGGRQTEVQLHHHLPHTVVCSVCGGGYWAGLEWHQRTPILPAGRDQERHSHNTPASTHTHYQLSRFLQTRLKFTWGGGWVGGHSDNQTEYLFVKLDAFLKMRPKLIIL